MNINFETRTNARTFAKSVEVSAPRSKDESGKWGVKIKHNPSTTFSLRSAMRNQECDVVNYKSNETKVVGITYKAKRPVISSKEV